LSAIAAYCYLATLFIDGSSQPPPTVLENYQVVSNDHPFARVFIDMHESSSDSVGRLQTALERAMRDYQPLHSQAAILESFKPIIIGFRIKRASYVVIRDLLGEHGIRVSEQAVIRFCRKHSTEIKRLSQGAQALPISMVATWKKPEDCDWPWHRERMPLPFVTFWRRMSSLEPKSAPITPGK
jgi:hypothetical protein